jgi:hypothetical protein
MNGVCDEVGRTADSFVSAAASRILNETEW